MVAEDGENTQGRRQFFQLPRKVLLLGTGYIGVDDVPHEEHQDVYKRQVLRRLFVGPEAEGLFTLMTINFFLMGVTMFCVGIAGEYIGRIFQEIRKRPRFLVNRIYGDEEE